MLSPRIVSSCPLPLLVLLATYLRLYSDSSKATMIVDAFCISKSSYVQPLKKLGSTGNKGTTVGAGHRGRQDLHNLMASSSSQENVVRKPSSSCGHVFILNCGANGIAADAILLKTNYTKSQSTSYSGNNEVNVKESKISKVRFYEAVYDTTNQDHNDAAVRGTSSIHDLFLNKAATYCKGKKSTFGRAKPLLAFDPCLMSITRENNDFNTKLIEHVLPLAYNIADENGVDIAICIPDEDSHGFVQKLRDDLCPFEKGPFWMLNNSQHDNASRLSTAVKAGRLSVFIGAGISIPSGAPSWGGLLNILAKEVGMNEEDCKNLGKLDVLDQPTIIADDMGGGFKSAVADVMNRSTLYTPCHVLLKTFQLPAVTSNYDNLYESAAASCGQYIPTLPWDSRNMIYTNQEERTSLLKLHGCVDYPESIILSRADYMRYPDSYQALRGRLQGMFLTTEMLFCGFSMTDDNVNKVIDDVRKVLYQHNGKPPKNKMGTILKMTDNKMFTRLWEQDFQVHSFGKSWDDHPNWYHDCFIDCIVADFTKNEDNIEE